MADLPKTRFVVTGTFPGYRLVKGGEKTAESGVVPGDVLLVSYDAEPDAEGDLTGTIERTGFVATLSASEDLTLESTVEAAKALAAADTSTISVEAVARAVLALGLESPEEPGFSDRLIRVARAIEKGIG